MLTPAVLPVIAIPGPKLENNLGIHENIVPLLREAADNAPFFGNLCTLGVQDLPESFRGVDFFSSIGFSNVEALDLSSASGADHIFDLNEDELPPRFLGRFDAVLNGGTLEHVFHVPNALTSITRMLGPQGHVIHLLPCNGWVDHGFYQISPTLMFDYYLAAGFSILESALCSFNSETPESWIIRPIRRGDLGTGLAGSINSGVHLYFFVARRGELVIERPTPLQGLYNGTTIRMTSQPRWFMPHIVRRGARFDLPVRAKRQLSEFAPESGHCWTVDLPELSDLADSDLFPARSPLIVLEDGSPLGPSHSEHRVVREVGMGAFSHWNNVLYFSTSDHSDPAGNGRKYSIVVPQAAKLGGFG